MIVSVCYHWSGPQPETPVMVKYAWQPLDVVVEPAVWCNSPVICIYLKHEGSHKPLALCLSLLIDIDRPIQHSTCVILNLYLFNSQTTVQPQQLNSKVLQNNSMKLMIRTEKLKILWLNSQNSKITWPKETTKYIKIIIIGRKRYEITHKATKY